MNTQQRNQLKERLATLDARDRKDIIREAANLRSKAQATGAKEAQRPVEWFMLDLLQRADSVHPIGTVVGVDRTRCTVRHGGREWPCRGAAELAPGDRVRFDRDVVVEVLPRRTTLHRREGHLDRLIAANLDLVVVVVSVVAPPFHPRIVDRYLAAIALGGASAALCVNKADLGVSKQEREAIEVYRGLVPVFITSTESLLGVDALRDFLRSGVAALVGHSGVGKSSLLNALVGSHVAEEGSVSRDTGKGQHTTTRSTLHETMGLAILDTPGIREFAVGFESPEDVVAGFSEIAAFGQGCRFANCFHEGEDDGCAVVAAVSQGRISRGRYESYIKLLMEAFP